MNPYVKYEQLEGSAGRVLLDDNNSDLNFLVENDGLTGSSLHKSGFEHLWAGARATHGVSRGKVFYEVSVKEKLEVIMTEKKKNTHVMRVGWSVDSSDLSVGESRLSYGYGGTGKSSLDNKFYDYGEPYSTSDIITCYIDLDSVPKTIFFAKNGKYLGVAFSMGPEINGKVFYPHVTVKNMKFVTNFGSSQPHFPPVQGFLPIEYLPPNLLCVPVMCLKERQHCEVVMMVGLPSCGKTTWLERFVGDHPEKKYYVLGTNEILRKMKVMGLTRKRNYHGRWDVLIKQATGILNEMLKIVQYKNRNYILDQTNVYPNARRRKMNNFRQYKHIAVVVVNTNAALISRNDKVMREDGKVIPESAFMEMKANFTLPVEGDIFDEVWYVEENQERSMELVNKFNNEGNSWKAEQKKRPASDSQQNEPSDMKRPKYEAPSAGGHYPNTGQCTNFSQSYNAGDMPRDFNGENRGFLSNNNSGQMSIYQGTSEDSSRQNRFSRGGPPSDEHPRDGFPRDGLPTGTPHSGGLRNDESSSVRPPMGRPPTDGLYRGGPPTGEPYRGGPTSSGGPTVDIVPFRGEPPTDGPHRGRSQTSEPYRGIPPTGGPTSSGGPTGDVPFRGGPPTDELYRGGPTTGEPNRLNRGIPPIGEPSQLSHHSLLPSNTQYNTTPDQFSSYYPAQGNQEYGQQSYPQPQFQQSQFQQQPFQQQQPLQQSHFSQSQFPRLPNHSDSLLGDHSLPYSSQSLNWGGPQDPGYNQDYYGNSQLQPVKKENWAQDQQSSYQEQYYGNYQHYQ